MEARGHPTGTTKLAEGIPMELEEIRKGTERRKAPKREPQEPKVTPKETNNYTEDTRRKPKGQEIYSNFQAAAPANVMLIHSLFVLHTLVYNVLVYLKLYTCVTSCTRVYYVVYFYTM